MKKIVYIDMDGVLADFEKGTTNWLHNADSSYYHRYKNHRDMIPGIFRTLPLIDGSKEAVERLYNSGLFELHIATAVPWGNPTGGMDKRLWVEDHFGYMFKKRITMTHSKDLLVGDYLIDDRVKNGAGDFGKVTDRGQFIHFGSPEFPDWKSVVDFLLSQS